MPEMVFVSHWPDGRELRSYSPSLVVHDHLSAGTRYTVADFLTRSRRALELASERVEARYGMPCTAARASLAAIETLAAAHPHGHVDVASLQPGPVAA